MRWEIAIRAQDEAVDLLHDALIAFPPTTRLYRADVPDHLRALGSYLLTLGYATPQQLILALHEQRQRAEQGTPWPLGDILVAQGILHPQVLTAVLLVQLVDRLVVWRGAPPQLLGEHLIAMEVLSPMQLAPALHRQIDLRQRGTWTRLGDLLITQGILDPQSLAVALRAQQGIDALKPVR
jgi:hypothetical protein